MKKQYTATTGFPYKTRHLVAGDRFDADEKLGSLLVKMRRATPAAEAPASPAPAQAVIPTPSAAIVVSTAVPEHEEAPAVAELPPVAEPESAAQGPDVPAAEEPAKPAFKTRRSYGSRSL